MIAKQFMATNTSTYDEIKAKCLKKKFKDPEFKADDRILYYPTPPKKASDKYKWRRPKHILGCSKKPEFIVDGFNRFDIEQGELGDCWLQAAMSCLSMRRDLVKKVVPDGQSFKDGDYAGVFRFNFWNFGKWVDVIIDDRLPTREKNLVYARSSEKREFWTALLEKAYAKLYGSYQAIVGGFEIEALEDLTGGIGESHILGDESPSYLWNIMMKSQRIGSLICCSTDSDPAHEQNGLVSDHAYSVTEVMEMSDHPFKDLKMVRVRNPWGDEMEWKGDWSDGASNWDLISQSNQQKIEFKSRPDGEFWMSFDEFLNNFHGLDICHLDPDAFGDEVVEPKRRRWVLSLCEGSWRKGTTAGGYIDEPTAWKNPQYFFTVVDVDDDNKDAGTVIIALMQKDRRKKGLDNLNIGYAIYEWEHSASTSLDENFNFLNVPTSQVKVSNAMREVCGRHELRPGSYRIVVFAEPAGEEADFLLRFFSEKPVRDL